MLETRVLQMLSIFSIVEFAKIAEQTKFEYDKIVIRDCNPIMVTFTLNERNTFGSIVPQM
jgi:hypothetical protein